jgi:hypothetical protein
MMINLRKWRYQSHNARKFCADVNYFFHEEAIFDWKNLQIPDFRW